MKLVSVVGTRPNLVKMAPVVAQLRRRLAPGEHKLVHTAQHYDRALSEVFIDELEMPEPDHVLGVGSGTHAIQTARVMERLEPVLLEERPDVLIVPGDVNSTLAAALVGAQLQIPVAHVESGLRSFDRTMPEELNRMFADRVAEYLFLHSEDAIENLRREGVSDTRMHYVGNTMIDTLVALEDRFRALRARDRFGLEAGDYLLVTLHRPALVDGPLLGEAMAALGEVARALPVVFPVHPRTRKMMAGMDVHPAIRIVDPLGYLEFLSLEADARAVLTDSGGIQEETTYLGVPCFTLRDNTERPVTVSMGTNTLLGLAPDRIREIPDHLSAATEAQRSVPDLWDGHAAARVADVLVGS
jgi:UDP-N-acetylglucosamine 2-epimerase (non-hydrolysing)